MRTLRTTTIERIRELRRARGLTQQQLAERLNLMGASIDQTAVAKIESGSRQLSLEEAFRFAMALDVAPLHLFVPTDSDDPINLGPNMSVTPAEAREWIRGLRPLLWQDTRTYYSTVPEKEFEAAQNWREAWEQMPWRIDEPSEEES